MGIFGAVMNIADEVEIVVGGGGVISSTIGSSGLTSIERKAILLPSHGQSIASKGRHSSSISMFLPVVETPETLKPG